MKILLEDKLNAPILEEINLQNNQYKNYSRDIIQNEILSIKSNKIFVILSNSLDERESSLILKIIFSNVNQYQELKLLNDCKVEDKIIFICDLSS